MPVCLCLPFPQAAEAPKPYSFQYGVEDPESKASFQASESQDTAGSVGGEYRVALPDGRLQTVKYSGDPASGYIAQVTYSGDAVYPPVLPGYSSLQYVTEYRGDYYIHPCHHHHVLYLSYLCGWIVPHHQIIMEKASQLSQKSGGSKISIKP